MYVDLLSEIVEEHPQHHSELFLVSFNINVKIAYFCLFLYDLE